MSYSFGVKAANKAAAKETVAAKFDEMVQQQPIHARDRAAVLANANTVIDLLAIDDTKDVTVSVNGYVSGTDLDKPEPVFTSVAVSCSAGHALRQ